MRWRSNKRPVHRRSAVSLQTRAGFWTRRPLELHQAPVQAAAAYANCAVLTQGSALLRHLTASSPLTLPRRARTDRAGRGRSATRTTVAEQRDGPSNGAVRDSEQVLPV